MHVLTNQDIPLDMTGTKHGVTQVAGFKTVSNFQEFVFKSLFQLCAKTNRMCWFKHDVH